MHRKLVGLVAAVAITAALVVGGIATAAQPVTSVSGDIHTEFNGDFSPKVLSKTKLTPVASLILGRLKTLSGGHVPPLRELVLEGDRNTSISVKDFPVCDPGIRSQSSPLDEMRRLCKESLVGSGTIKVEIKFHDQPPIPVTSELLAFNGGFKGGVATFYLHAYITVPTPAAIITGVKVKRVNKGRFGWQAVATIPKIAGGSGSITYFKLRLEKGILSAKCPDSYLKARATAVFNATPPMQLSASITRPCTGL